MTPKDVLDWLTLIAASLSAFFWLRSSVLELPVSMAEATIDSVGQLIGLNKKGERVDLYPIVLKQARLNGYGAAGASVAAISQVAVKILAL